MCCLFAVFAFTLPQQAGARGLQFGKSEKINHIADVKLKGAKQEALFLAYKTTTQSFLLPAYMNDDGYVLGVVGDSKKYYSMPKAEKLAAFQKNGYLPNPLPKYAIPFLDYLFGYLLWVTVGVLLLWGLGRKTLRRKKDTVEEAATG